MKNESFRRSFSMLCAAVGLIVLMGIAVAGADGKHGTAESETPF